MAVNQRTHATIRAWRPTTSPSPISEDADNAVLPRQPLTTDEIAHNTAREFQRLHATVNSLTEAATQATDVSPLNPLNGWVRYATGDWATALGAEGLYVYKSGAWTLIA